MPDFMETSDFLNNSTVLRKHMINRQVFDPQNPEHLQSLDQFIRTGNWGTIQFYCEHPFTDVPMTVLMKFAAATRRVSRETADERRERLSNQADLIRMSDE